MLKGHCHFGISPDLDANAEIIDRSPVSQPGEQLLPERELHIGAIQQKRAGIVWRFKGLLKQEQGLEKAGLAGAVSSGKNRQRPDLDCLLGGYRFKAAHSNLGDSL